MATGESVQSLAPTKQELKEEKRLSEANMRKEKALKSMKYLLQVSQTYSDFFKNKLKDNEEKKKQRRKVLKVKDTNRLLPSMQDMTDDAVLTVKQRKVAEAPDADDLFKYLQSFVGTLRDYQIVGLKWMLELYENGMNGILADEMGLGKTIQVIALLCHMYEKGESGPFLIVVPLSTLPNWKSEFERFAPSVPVVVFYGTEAERREIAVRIRTERFVFGGRRVMPVVLVSYQVPLMEKFFIGKFRWQYLIVDEGHRIKNHKSMLGQCLRNFQSQNRLLLTGTPLQNNMMELWSLLNFLLPHIFADMESFAEVIAMEDMADSERIIESEKSDQLITTIHHVLKPFMLRRLKVDVLGDIVPKKEVQVYCPLSPLQREIYTYVLQRDIAKLRGIEDDDEVHPCKKRKCAVKKPNFYSSKMMFNDQDSEEDDEEEAQANKYDEFIEKEERITGMALNKDSVQYLHRVTMQNSLSMLRKTVGHPYLVHFPLDPNSKEKRLLINEDLVRTSGKMQVLDAMLVKLKQRGHKVLIFSTLVIMLDLIEELLIMRGYRYGRLDGECGIFDRAQTIREFNENPDVFLYIVSTRAGGLGINLTGADTVIFYDRDWNPQVDIQAQDRCHRIGQTKPVMVYSLVAKNTIDEKVIQYGVMKRKLEKVVMKDGKFTAESGNELRKTTEQDLLELKSLLETDKFHKIHANGYVYSDEELDALLDRSELYAQMRAKK